ncbi:MAG: carboxypeptidase-like regulatory domain-containing protein, partial [Paludibacter sp.]
MRKVITLFVVIMMAQLSFSQVLVKGIVVDKTTNEALVGVSVFNPATSVGVMTALDGSFAIKVPSGNHSLTVSYIGYTSQTIQVLANNPNVGTIALVSESIGLNDVVVTSSIAIRRKTPVALSVIDPIIIETKLGTQEFPEILKSTPGVYATKQGGGYGDSRINLRGFEAPNIAVMINGVPMNDMEWGGIYWSNWGALSDVTRSMQVQRGLGASKVAAPSLGGSINVLTRT